MALDDMLRAIEEEGEKRRQDILKKGKDESAEIVSKAKDEAKGIKDEYVRRAQSALQGEKTRILSDAKLHVKKQVIQAKERFIEDAFTEAATDLERMRKSPDYAGYFRRLLEETVANAEGRLIVSVDKRDEEVCRDCVRELGLDCEVKADVTTLGGLKATTVDGRITLTNTLDSRLERAKQLLKPRVATILFG